MTCTAHRAGKIPAAGAKSMVVEVGEQGYLINGKIYRDVDLLLNTLKSMKTQRIIIKCDDGRLTRLFSALAETDFAVALQR